MIRGAQRWKACVSLAGYVLALAAAGLFHDHAHHDDAAGSIADAVQSRTARRAASSHSHGRCDHDHRHTAARHGNSQSPRQTGPRECEHEHSPHHDGSPHHHDDCPVCQFLALKQLPAMAPVVIAGSEPVTEPAELFVTTLPHALPWRPLSRAPPACV